MPVDNTLPMRTTPLQHNTNGTGVYYIEHHTTDSAWVVLPADIRVVQSQLMFSVAAKRRPYANVTPFHNSLAHSAAVDASRNGTIVVTSTRSLH